METLKKAFVAALHAYAPNEPTLPIVKKDGNTKVAGLVHHLTEFYKIKQFMKEFDANTVPVDMYDYNALQALVKAAEKIREYQLVYLIDVDTLTPVINELQKQDNISGYRLILDVLNKYHESRLLITICSLEPRDKIRKALSVYVSKLLSKMVDKTPTADDQQYSLRLPKISETYTVDELIKKLPSAVTNAFSSYSLSTAPSYTAVEVKKCPGVVFIYQITPHPSQMDYSKVFAAPEGKFQSASVTSVRKYDINHSYPFTEGLCMKRLVINPDAEEFIICVTYTGDKWWFTDPYGRPGVSNIRTIANPPREMTHQVTNTDTETDIYSSLVGDAINATSNFETKEAFPQINVIKIMEMIMVKVGEYWDEQIKGTVTRPKFDELLHDRVLRITYAKCVVSEVISIRNTRAVTGLIIAQADKSSCTWMRSLHNISRLSDILTKYEYLRIVRESLEVSLPVIDAPVFDGLQFV